MSNQKKKSFKQIIKSEYKIILFFAAVFLFIPVLTEGIIVSDLARLNGLSALEKLGVLIGVSQFSFTNTEFLSIFSLIIFIIFGPVLPLVMARKLNGQRLKDSLRDGFSDYGKSRTWKYIGFVYVPYVLVVAVVLYCVTLVPATSVLTLLSKLLESTVLLVVVIFLLLVISVLVSTITSIFVVGNIVYARSQLTIKQVFKLIPSREINKLLLFNLTESAVGILLVLAFVLPAMAMNPLSLVMKAISMIIGFIVLIIVYQIAFVYIRLSIYMNSASKIEIEVGSEDKVVTNKTVEAAKAQGIEESTAEMSIKPKNAKRKHRLNPEGTPRIKPKRTIK